MTDSDNAPRSVGTAYQLFLDIWNNGLWWIGKSYLESF